MSREILFRGKIDKNDNWVYGSLNNTDPQFPEIMYCDKNWNVHSHLIKPETIGQFTGLIDKNGTKIFEGDICKYYNQIDYDGICVIENWNTSFVANWIGGTIKAHHLITSMFYLSCGKEFEVIGNIYDNPELLEV